MVNIDALIKSTWIDCQHQAASGQAVANERLCPLAERESVEPLRAREDAANNGHGAGGHSHAGETSADSTGTNGWLSRFPRICETAPGWSMLPKADGSPDQK